MGNLPQSTTCHTDEVVSGKLTHRTILTDGRGGREQPFDVFSGKENAYAMICNTVHVGGPMLKIDHWSAVPQF